MISQRQKYGLQRFILGKSAGQTLHGQSKLRYKKNIEKALVISILGAIFGFRLAANFDMAKFYLNEDKITFEFIDIPLIQPFIKQPPALKMEEVVEIKSEENEQEQSNSNLEEIEELLGENEEDAELALDSDELGAFLLSNSPLGNITGPKIKFRRRADIGEVNISIKKSKSFESLLAESEEDIDIGEVQHSERESVSDNININLKAKTDKTFNEPVKERYNSSDDISLTISDVPEKILTSASSTIGTEDYKLWNKIQAELDRLYKGRYGMIPKELKRNKRGFTLTLKYSDGIKHEFYWQKYGHVLIKVSGRSDKTALQELRRALDGLLTLSLSN
ncbi:MAG: hypothetical protein ACE5JB_06765 [bacterium]